MVGGFLDEALEGFSAQRCQLPKYKEEARMTMRTLARPSSEPPSLTPSLELAALEPSLELGRPVGPEPHPPVHVLEAVFQSPPVQVAEADRFHLKLR
jgi:hypothetical protein